jgi:hypothetical protein
MNETAPRSIRREGDAPQGRSPAARVPWFPDYLLLESGAALICVAVLSVVALTVDAPLLDIADPGVTPDPSKAPWYFVGLQELLHYYPPVVAGALVPGGVVVLLLVAPFAPRTALWAPDEPRSRRLGVLALGLGLLLATEVVVAQHVPWLIVVPTVGVGVAMLAPGLLPGGGSPRWLARWSLVAWIALWVGLCAVGLTVVGALFRGPGWSWALPWAGGGL